MSYEDVLKGLSEGSARVIGQLWQAVEVGQLPIADFEELAADLVAIARAQGALAAQAALRAYMEATYLQPVAAVVGASYGDRERLALAIGTILASQQDTAMQLARLAANEPLAAAADAYHDAMQTTEAVSGWTRGLEADACQLCRWWWREGRVWPADHRMPRHTGCACHPIPTINPDPASASASRRRRTR